MRLRCAAVTRVTALLVWDVREGAVAFHVGRRLRSAVDEDFELLAMIAPEQPMFMDPALSADTLYLYEVTEIRRAPGEGEESRPAQVETVLVRTKPPNEFADRESFYMGFLANIFRRKLASDGEATWCEEWWRHPEAGYVIDQLWHSYEATRPPDPPAAPGAGRAQWLVQILYPLLERMVLAHGPFIGCDPREPTGERHRSKNSRLPHLVDPNGKYLPDK